MGDAPSAFPLTWPAHKPRTPAAARKRGQFRKQGDRGYMVDVTTAVAIERLEAEVTALGARYALLSSNIEIRLDGRPRSGAPEPADPGVCVYFQLKGRPYALACDTYSAVAQNIAALAAHIEATRAITRHGVASAAETLQAFAALPPPGAPTPAPARPWREVLGFKPTFTVGVDSMLSPDQIKSLISDQYRAKAKAVGEGGLLDLNTARDAALKELQEAGG